MTDESVLFPAPDAPAAPAPVAPPTAPRWDPAASARDAVRQVEAAAAAEVRRVKLLGPAVGFGLLFLLLCLTLGALVWHYSRGGAGPASEGERLGAALRQPAAAAIADGEDAYADAVKAGKTGAEADAALKARLKERLNAAYARVVAPSADAILPAGKDFQDQAQRDRAEAFHRAVAAGLRRGGN